MCCANTAAEAGVRHHHSFDVLAPVDPRGHQYEVLTQFWNQADRAARVAAATPSGWGTKRGEVPAPMTRRRSGETPRISIASSAALRESASTASAAV